MSKLRWSWFALGWLWVAAIFYLSLMPHPPEPVHFRNADKLEHALAYSLLMLWFCQVYRQCTSRMLLAVLLLAMGIAIEYLQRETGYRTFEYADMLADTVGVMVGWACACIPGAPFRHKQQAALRFQSSLIPLFIHKAALRRANTLNTI
jgi:VanZ family protein